MNMHATIPHSHASRRDFLTVTAAAGGGLMISLALGCGPAVAAASNVFEPNIYIRIPSTGKIAIVAKSPELGQGIRTAFPMIIAEELDAAWSDIEIETAVVDVKYGRQVSGGSNGIRFGWDELRRAGAVGRAMLVAAAAETWKVPESECRTENSQVFHEKSGRRLKYGELAEAAARQKVPDPQNVTLKAPDKFRLVGKPMKGVDTPAVVAGEALFSIDRVVPGMLIAVFEKCPAVGGKVKSANLDAIRKMPGVKQAFIVEGTGKVQEVMPGVAILAVNTWSALKAKTALQIEWDESDASKDSFAALRRYAHANKNAKPMDTLRKDGDVDAALKSAAKVVDALYEHPYLPHVTMEPQNSIAWHKGETVEVWGPSQQPQFAQNAVAKALGLPPEKVTIHQPRRVGGAFGRRLIDDVMCEAAMISKLAGNIPVKLMWTREDDMRHDHYRGGGFHQITAGLDANGKVIAWRDHALLGADKTGTKVAGGAPWPTDIPAELVPNLEFVQSGSRFDTPMGAWRGPRSNAICFSIHSFIHELSVAAGKDHLDFLIEMFGDPRKLPPAFNGHGYYEISLDTGRAVACMKLAADKAGWGRKLPPGRGLGFAFHYSHCTYACDVVELSVDAANKLKVHKITAVVDAGQIVNPDGARHQVEGSIVDGFSTLLRLAVDIENGRIQQGNFHEYDILKMTDSPAVEVHFVPSTDVPTGLGEPALPPLAPAVCNAIFAATGRRIRTLPLIKSGITV